VNTKAFRLGLLIFSMLTLLVFARTQSGIGPTEKNFYYQPQSPKLWLFDVACGQLPGMCADFSILRVFTIYSDTSQKTLDNEQNDYAWSTLHQELQIAQHLDPKFRDTYRLAEGLLPYDANMPNEAVALLSKGSQVMDDWLIPLVASFIASTQLNDKKRALTLAQIATGKTNAPVMAFGFASRLMKDEISLEAAIAFLQARKQTLPPSMQHGIEIRIQKLKEQAESKPDAL